MDKIISEVARNLRKNLTPSEQSLWKHLRQEQLGGFKFRRQQPIGKFIADFVCFEKRLIVEVDGEVHLSQKERDNERDLYLKESGFKVVRFSNEEIERDIKGVLGRIRENIAESSISDLPRKWSRE